MRYDKRIPTVKELFETWAEKTGIFMTVHREIARKAFVAGRKEGQTYPHGRRVRRGARWGRPLRRNLAPREQEPEGTHNGIPK